MAQTAFVKSTVPGPNAVTGAAVTMNACDATNGNSIQATGDEACVVMNSSTTTAYTFTITGVVDPYGRTSNFSMSIAASGAIATPTIVVTPKLNTSLWASSGLILTPNTNNAALLVGVLTGL